MHILTKYHHKIVDKQYKQPNDPYTRYNGGGQNGRVIVDRPHPYVSGYWILLLVLPLKFNAYANTDDPSECIRQLAVRAESFTPPSRTIEKADIIGFNGVKQYVITGQSISNQFTLTFREYQKLPIYNIISQWSMAINPYTGQITKGYKGYCGIGFLKPVGNGLDIDPTVTLPDFHFFESFEQFYFFDGVFPEAQPVDKFATDISTNDLQTIDVTFNFDGFLMDDVFDKAAFYNDFKDNLGIQVEKIDPIWPA